VGSVSPDPFYYNANGKNFNEVEALDRETDNDSTYDQDNFDDNCSSDDYMSEEECPYE